MSFFPVFCDMTSETPWVGGIMSPVNTINQAAFLFFGHSAPRHASTGVGFFPKSLQPLGAA